MHLNTVYGPSRWASVIILQSRFPSSVVEALLFIVNSWKSIPSAPYQKFWRGKEGLQ